MQLIYISWCLSSCVIFFNYVDFVTESERLIFLARARPGPLRCCTIYSICMPMHFDVELQHPNIFSGEHILLILRQDTDFALCCVGVLSGRKSIKSLFARYSQVSKQISCSRDPGLVWPNPQPANVCYGLQHVVAWWTCYYFLSKGTAVCVPTRGATANPNSSCASPAEWHLQLLYCWYFSAPHPFPLTATPPSKSRLSTYGFYCHLIF